jgi:hypothetical protein
MELLAESTPIGTLLASDWHSVAGFDRVVAGWQQWRIRPRALTLTIWARLMLADLFIHGIGGAKYDRVTDDILANYYGLEPPHRACVSATLHLDLPVEAVSEQEHRAARHRLRDLQFNLPRYLPLEGALAELAAERQRAIDEAGRLRQRRARDRVARRAAFRRIRDLNAELLRRSADLPQPGPDRLAMLERGVQNNRIAASREFFVGLFDRLRLEQLLAALPAADRFGV